MRECHAVHSPGSDLDDSDGGGGEEGVEAGSFDAGGFLPVDRARAEAELAGLTVAADVDVEFCCWGSVKRCEFGSFFGGVGDRFGGAGTLFVRGGFGGKRIRGRSF